MVLLHVLFEHAVGYALLALKEVEEISLLQPQVEESVLNLGKFHNIVRLVAFCPFASSQVALEMPMPCLKGLFMRTSACSWRPTCHPKRRKYSWELGIPRLVLQYRRS